MQKTMKIISTLLVVIMLLFTVSTVVHASDSVEGVLGQMEEGKDQVGDTANGVARIGGQIASILTTVGIVVAVIVLLVLGIKYMMGSASEKAEYKKTMIPYLVGALLILGASAIVKIIFNITIS